MESVETADRVRPQTAVPSSFRQSLFLNREANASSMRRRRQWSVPPGKSLPTGELARLGLSEGSGRDQQVGR
jgi:hypothetical protein